MALKNFSPTSAGRRHLVLVDRSELHKGKPVKALVEGLTKSGGRSNTGRVTAFRTGGGHKRLYRKVDFKRRAKWGVDAYGPSQMAIYRFDQVDLVKQGAYLAVFYEWKPRPDLTWRVELDNIAERANRTTNYVHGGPRGTNGPVYVEDRDRSASRLVYLRLRKTLP